MQLRFHLGTELVFYDRIFIVLTQSDEESIKLSKYITDRVYVFFSSSGNIFSSLPNLTQFLTDFGQILDSKSYKQA